MNVLYVDPNTGTICNDKRITTDWFLPNVVVVGSAGMCKTFLFLRH